GIPPPRQRRRHAHRHDAIPVPLGRPTQARDASGGAMRSSQRRHASAAPTARSTAAGEPHALLVHAPRAAAVRPRPAAIRELPAGDRRPVRRGGGRRARDAPRATPRSTVRAAVALRRDDGDRPSPSKHRTTIVRSYHGPAGRRRPAGGEWWISRFVITLSHARDPHLTTALSDRYVIQRELGSGGMAVVYLAHDRKLDRDVALKVLRPELGAVLGAERFLTEIKISAQLDHPHILTLIDSGDADGMLYYVLPYVRGETLRDKVTRERQLAIDEAFAITKQVASALDYAHRQGLVHRDIKPENILLQEGEAMLTDFGIALAVNKAGGNRLTQTGLSLGTPQYMSPEQATGDRTVDARSDLYSLASVLYEMLVGDPPVTGSNAQVMIAKLMTERPTHVRVLRDTVPEAVDAAIAKALSKTPADRFASAGDFVRALEAGMKPEAATVARPAGGGSRSSAFKVAVAALIVAAVAAVAIGVWTMRGRSTPVVGSQASLSSKTQLTVSGGIYYPAISPDGKQLAFVERHCTGADCTYSIVVQDVGGTTTRSILDGATSMYDLRWSP